MVPPGVGTVKELSVYRLAFRHGEAEDASMLAFSHEDKKDAIKRWWKKRIWKRVRARNQRLGTPWVREIPPTHPEDLPTLRDANRPDTNDY